MPARRLVAPFLATLVLALLPASPASAALGPLSQFGAFGGGAGQIHNPGNIAFAPNGNLYVADFGNNRVSVFSPDGIFLFAFGKEVNKTTASDRCDSVSGCQAGAGGDAAGVINTPEDVAFLEGNVYVTERGNDRVSIFTEAGAFVAAFGREVNFTDQSDVCTLASKCTAGATGGGDASLDEPSGILAVGKEIYVADALNFRVDVFDPNGTFIGAFGKEVSTGGADLCLANDCQIGAKSTEAGGFTFPYSLALDHQGRLLIGDLSSARIDFYTTEGAFVSAFGLGVDPSGGNTCTALTGCQIGEGGDAAGALPEPGAIAADAAGNIYVDDGRLNRVSEFTADGAFIRAFGEGVATGAKAFETCTTSCRTGGEDTIPGAIIRPFGLAFDAAGRIFVSESGEEEPPRRKEFARVEVFGELPEPPAEKPPAGGTTPPSSAGAPPSAGPLPTAPPSVPSNKIVIGKLKLNKRNGTGTLTVTVPGPGTLVLKGSELKPITRRLKRAGKVKLPVRPKRATQTTILESGGAVLIGKLTFTPTGGSPATTTKRLTLKRK